MTEPGVEAVAAADPAACGPSPLREAWERWPRWENVRLAWRDVLLVLSDEQGKALLQGYLFGTTPSG